MEARDHKGGPNPSDLDKAIKGHEGVLPRAHLLTEPQLPSVSVQVAGTAAGKSGSYGPARSN